MCDESGPDKLPDKDRQIGRNRRHSALEVVEKLAAVFGELYHLWGGMGGQSCPITRGIADS